MDTKKLYEQALGEKTFIIGKYAEVARHTMPYTQVYNEHTKTVDKHINIIDPVILQSSLELKNWIMSTMLGRGAGWADALLNRDSFEEISLDIPQITQKQYTELNDKLSKYTEKEFELLNNSSFYNATAKAVIECENLGTGCIAIVENDSATEPFSFIHLPINSVYFTEDYLGRPTHTFRKFTNVTNDNIMELFGITTDIDLSRQPVLIESCVKVGEGQYVHQLSTEAFDEILFEEEIPYPIHIVFRWDTSLANVYGVGIGMYLIDEFARLAKFKELYRESAELMVNPPLGFHGSIEFMNKMSFSAGSMSYLGQDNNISGVSPIGLGTQLIPIENEIMKSEQMIRDSYISNPIGYYQDKSNTTAAEINARMMLFRERFSGVYENLSEELLKTTFIAIFRLLTAKGIFEFGEEYIDMIELKYRNEAAKALEQDKISDLLKYKQIGLAYFPSEEKFIVDNVNMLNEIGELMGIRLENRREPEEATQLYVKYLNTVANGGASNETTGTGTDNQTVR